MIPFVDFIEASDFRDLLSEAEVTPSDLSI